MFIPSSRLSRFSMLIGGMVFLSACSSTPTPRDPKIEIPDLRTKMSEASPSLPLIWMEPDARSVSPDVGHDDMQAFSARSADIRDVLITLFDQSDLNLMVAPEVSGSVTFDFRATSQEEALLNLVDLLGLSIRRQGDFMIVEGRKTKTFHLDYVSGTIIQGGGGGSDEGGSDGGGSEGGGSAVAVDPWETLKQEIADLLSPETRVVLKPEAGTVVASGSLADLDVLEKFLADLEKSLHRQVVIEAEILEVSLDDEHRLGVAYSVFPGALPSDETGLLENGAAFVANLLSGGNAFRFGLFKQDRYGVLVDAMKSVGQVRVLSRPRVATLNNQPASITVADQVPVIERTIIDGETSRTEFDIRFEDAGVVLNLLPQISSGGDIVTRISPRITEVVGQVTTPDGLQTEPILSVRETTTTLRIKDGQSVVIGGLRFMRQIETVEKIPVLGDIPLLGIAFRRTIQSERQVELVLVLTPHTVDDARQVEELRKARHYIQETKRPFHLGLFFDSPPDGSFFDAFSAATMDTILNEVKPDEDTSLEESQVDASLEGSALSRSGLAMALMRRAIMDYEAGRIQKAEVGLEAAREYAALGGLPYIYLAAMARREGDLESAERYLTTLHQSNSSNVLVVNNLAALYLSRGEWQLAKELLTEAVVEHPDDSVLRVNLATVLTSLGRGAEAVDHLQSVLRTDPKHTVARSHMEKVLNMNRMLPAAPPRGN